MISTYETKGVYVDNLTAEILAAVGDIINQKVTDADFMHAHDLVSAIIAREYVERKDQVIIPAELNKLGRPKTKVATWTR